ncbi:hypothetical protein JW960_05210 [candidate division KSB1 bacterium]|nr:hypothetical protein [candidate division KSB1 bacterium]
MQKSKKKSASAQIIQKAPNLCEWVELGVLSYKICRRNYKCETCPLDQALRGTNDDLQIEIPTQRKQMPQPDRSFLQYFTGFKGLIQLDQDGSYYVHPQHTWVKVLKNDIVRIGIDDIVAVVLGSVDRIILPKPGSVVEKGHSCAQIVQNGHIFSIQSPIKGHILQVNDQLATLPDQATLDPLRNGWLLSIKPDNLAQDLSHCRSGDILLAWYLQEMKWLETTLAAGFQQRQLELGPTMADGGEISHEIRYYMTDDQYRKLVVNLLGSV